MEKTNSWYWRRMSRAAAQDGKDGKDGSTADGTGKEKVHIYDDSQHSSAPLEKALEAAAHRFSVTRGIFSVVSKRHMVL